MPELDEQEMEREANRAYVAGFQRSKEKEREREDKKRGVRRYQTRWRACRDEGEEFGLAGEPMPDRFPLNMNYSCIQAWQEGYLNGLEQRKQQLAESDAARLGTAGTP